MEPSETGAARPAAGPADRLAELSASARGWHTIQMAVLGFIGICGVLRTTDSAPRAVQWLAAALAVAALAAASLAIFSVGRVAYPVNDAAEGASARPSAGQAAARLRAGIRLTIVAVILAVIAALSGWWPAKASTPLSPSPAPTARPGAVRSCSGGPVPSASAQATASSPCPPRASPRSARSPSARRPDGPGSAGWLVTPVRALSLSIPARAALKGRTITSRSCRSSAGSGSWRSCWCSRPPRRWWRMSRPRR